MKGNAELPTGEFNDEARRLVKIIKDSGNMYRLRESDQSFVNGLNCEGTITRKMVFWLRDLRDKVI